MRSTLVFLAGLLAALAPSALACSSTSTNEASGGGAGASAGGGSGTGGGGGTCMVTPPPQPLPLAVPGEVCKDVSTDVGTLVCCSSGAAAGATVPWDAARASCIARGRDLVKVTSASMNSAIKSAMSPRNVWNGLSDTVSESQFVWTDGACVGDFAPWGPTEPQSKFKDTNQNCVMISTGLEPRWFDVSCTSPALTVTAWCCSPAG